MVISGKMSRPLGNFSPGPPKMKRLFLTLLLLALTACVPIIKDGQPASAAATLPLSARQSLGQTLVAREAGLQGVEIFMRPGQAASGKIKLHLRAAPQSADDLALAKLPVQNIHQAGWVRFDFPAQRDSRQKDYYFWLELEGPGSALVDTAPGDSYAEGALYQNGAPLDAQMTFRLVYQPRVLMAGLLAQSLNWAEILAAGIFLFLLPGWALLMGLWPGWQTLSAGEKIGLAAGSSLALYPLLFLWANLAGLQLGALTAWLPPLIGLSALLWRWASDWRAKKFRIAMLRPPNWNLRLALPDLALLLLLALIIFTRFWVIRALDVPMWGDSYQHTMIVQLLVDNGGLFNSWQPYAELQTFTYHFGFHAAAAVFHWVSGLNAAQSTLWTGQILNILAVAALYPLALRVSGSRWAGAGAVLAAGLLAPMPMYYLNWGRYTQLAGQLILPAAITLAWAALENTAEAAPSAPALAPKFSLPLPLGPSILLWLLWSGLALTHYRVLIFAIPFFAAFLALYGKKGRWKTLLTQIFWLGAGAALLFLPWFLHTFAGKILLAFSAQLNTPAAAVAASTQEYNSIGELSSYLPLFLWLLLPIGLIVGFLRREKRALLIVLWWLLVLLAANPQWLRLPGEGALSNFAVFIAAYIPVGALAGYLLGQITNKPGKIKRGNLLALTVLILLLGAGGWGARQRLKDFEPQPHALATRPDLRAAAWIRDNLPQNSRFLVNSFFAYGDTVIVGSDGGWWLPLLAQRSTTLPPLNYGSEQGPFPGYGLWINELTQQIQDKGITHGDTLALLREHAVTHIYIGQNQGRINYGGPNLLEPAKLLENRHFRLIYHQDRVWIFEIQQNNQ